MNMWGVSLPQLPTIIVLLCLTIVWDILLLSPDPEIEVPSLSESLKNNLSTQAMLLPSKGSCLIHVFPTA